MALLKRGLCLAPGLASKFIKKGTITIYDGATFHQGLENLSGTDRDVLKLEVGADDFPTKRNYIQRAPKVAQEHVWKFRKAFGLPSFGQAG